HGRAVREWSIHHVAVTGDPADVGGTPVKILVFEIEDPLRRQVRLQKVTGGRVENAFGFPGGAGRVQDVERMFAVELFGRTIDVDSLHQLVPPEITAFL